MALKVLGIGDNVADHYLHTNTIYPGGNAFNFAAYAKMLGADASYLGVFGDDFPGRHVYRCATEIGIHLDRCRIEQGENGCPKVRIENGDRIFVRSNKGGVSRTHPLTLDEGDLTYIAGFDLMHSSIYSYLEHNLEAMKATGVPISFDFSNSGDDAYYAKVCPYVTFAIVSCGHLSEADTSDLIAKLHGYGARYVVATRGEHGSCFSDSERTVTHPAHMVEAKDTLGAGDSYLTAFLLSFCEWLNAQGDDAASREEYNDIILKSMEAGSRFAAENCMVDGAYGYGAVYEGYVEA